MPADLIIPANESGGDSRALGAVPQKGRLHLPDVIVTRGQVVEQIRSIGIGAGGERYGLPTLRRASQVDFDISHSAFQTINCSIAILVDKDLTSKLAGN